MCKLFLQKTTVCASGFKGSPLRLSQQARLWLGINIILIQDCVTRGIYVFCDKSFSDHGEVWWQPNDMPVSAPWIKHHLTVQQLIQSRRILYNSTVWLCEPNPFRICRQCYMSIFMPSHSHSSILSFEALCGPRILHSALLHWTLHQRGQKRRKSIKGRRRARI